MEGLRTLIGGRYRLDQVIGRGGMSTVYLSEDTVLHRTVAIKVLSAALAGGDPVWVARFEREARAAASLTHPGVATIYDTGVKDGTRFIVMEFVRGRSLSDVLREQAPFEPARAVRIGVQVADVLSAAHAAGIIHRDIKPGNVMVGAGDTVKVLDFGIARALGATALTQSVSVLGTAAYMAPEQAAGTPADERSDIYSLGCVLYAMLTGAPPFGGEHAAAVMHQHVNAEPRPLRGKVPETAPALEALVAQMLAKSPAARPRSAAEVRDRLGTALEATAATLMAVGAHAGRSVPDHRRRRGAWAAAAMLALLLIAAVAIATSGGSSGRQQASPNPPAATPSTTAAPRVSSSTKSTPSPARPSSTSSTTPSAPANAPPAATKPKPARKEKPPGHGGSPPGKAKGKEEGGG